MMIVVLLIEYIYMLRIHLKQNINISLENLKMIVLKIQKVQRLLWNNKIICRMFIKILKSITQEENVMY